MIQFRISILLVFFVSVGSIQSQVVYQHVSDKNIYEFLDELANEKIIEINAVVKPYSRIFIAEKLIEASAKPELLNNRQRKEIDFYLLDYKLEVSPLPDYDERFDFIKSKNLATTLNPLGGCYKDDLFTFVIKPIWGINYFVNDNENIFHRWGGLEAHAYVGKHWGFYASLRDNNETKRISSYDFLTQRPGGAYKFTDEGGGDYSEMRGGVVYSWKWGSFGLVKDHLTWGSNNHGANIFTDRAPSFAQIKLNVKPAKWFELNYMHGWLVSMEIDSVRSYFNPPNPPRDVYRPKYIAANMITITPWKGLNISAGNSIIYSDMNVHPAYLIPVMFYKSIDHTVNNGIDNQNSQMFFDISSRNIKNLNLYATLYIDELKLDRIGVDSLHNFWSAKTGAKVSNLLKSNLSLTAEYTMTRPVTFQHRVPTLTFQSNYYNMGHYLRDNSREYYLQLMYKPIRGLHVSASYSLAQHGPDYDYIIGTDISVASYPFLSEITWQEQRITFGAKYEFINNAYVFAELWLNEVTGDEEVIELYSPEFFRGDQTIISAGFNIGF